MKFCYKCGASITEGTKFCPKCGLKLDTELDDNKDNTSDTSNTDSEDSSDTNNSIELKNNSFIFNHKIIISVIVACVIIGTAIFIFIGNILSDPTNVITSFESAVNKNDTSSLSKILYCSDERVNLDANSIKPLLQDFNTTPSELSDIINTLSSQALAIKSGHTPSETNNIYIINEGKTLLFFPKYKIAVTPTYLTITSDVKGVNVAVNGKKAITLDSNNSSEQLGPYIPGMYNVIGNVNGDFGNMHNQVKVDTLKSNKKINNVDILEGTYLLVSSTYNTNEIYVNGKDIGKSASNGDTIGPIQVGATVYATTNYDGKQIKSSYSTISSHNKTIDFDYTSEQDSVQRQQTDISDMISNYCSALTGAINSKDASSLTAYLYPGSDFYTQQTSNIQSYPSGFYEQYDSSVVNSYTMDPDGESGTVNTTEVYDINEDNNDSNSQTKTETYDNVYKFKYNTSTQSFQLSERTSAVQK